MFISICQFCKDDQISMNVPLKGHGEKTDNVYVGHDSLDYGAKCKRQMDAYSKYC